MTRTFRGATVLMAAATTAAVFLLGSGVILLFTPAAAPVHELHRSIHYPYQRLPSTLEIPSIFISEQLSVYSEDGNFLRNATAWQVHTEGLFHRDVQSVVTDEHGRVLLSKRSSAKWVFPDVWDIGVSETVEFSESFEEAIIRGLKEELGVDLLVRSEQKQVASASRIDGRSGSSSGRTKLRVVEWRKDVAMQRFCWRGAMPHMYLQDCQLGIYLDLFQRPSAYTVCCCLYS